MVDKNEAPRGFFAEPKPKYSRIGKNICELCDWRNECQSGNADFEDSNNRCMSYPVVSAISGNIIQRADGQSVIFKRL
jgi:hypothetical protein